MKGTEIFRRNVEFRIRRIRGRYLLLGRENCLEMNETGKKIWEEIDGEKMIKEIAKVISDLYQTDYFKVVKDVSVFINTLYELGAVLKVENE